jgi:amino acid transporter
LAELAVLFPEAGGSYVYIREAYGRLAAFLFGWVEYWIVQSASLAALATMFTQEFTNILSNPVFQELLGVQWGAAPLSFVWQQVLSVGVILAMAWVNYRGVRWGGWMQGIVTTIKVATLLAILVLPLVALGIASSAKPHAEYLQPVWPESWNQERLVGFGTALVGVLWACSGWMNVAMVAGEVRRPSRNMPLALLAGVGIVIFLYLGANLAYSLMLSRQEMADSKEMAVATLFRLRLLGPTGAIVASAALMVSVFGASNGALISTPRIVFKMGEDGLAPKALGHVHPVYRTPDLSIWLFAAWSCLLVVGAAVATNVSIPALNLPSKKPLFDILTDFAIFGAVLFETLAVSAIFPFRRRLPHAERPYKCPVYPWVPLLYVGIMALVAAHMFVNQRLESSVGLVFIAVGAGVYGCLSWGTQYSLSRQVDPKL